MLFTNGRRRRLHKDKASILHYLKDVSKIFTENNKLKRSFTLLGLPIDPAKQKSGLSACLILKYSKQDLQQILRTVLAMPRLKDFNKSRKRLLNFCRPDLYKGKSNIKCYNII